MLPKILLLALALLAGLFAPPALASGDDVVRDCADDGQLSKRYSSAELREAINSIPTDVDEYSDCRDIIRRAQLDAGSGRDAAGSPGGGGPGGGGAAGTPAPAPKGPGGDQLAGASPEERRRIEALRTDRDAAGKVGGSVVRASGGDAGADVPTPLLVMLIIGALALAGAGGYAIRSRGLPRGAA